MEGRKLLNLSLQTLLSRGFLRFLFLFTILYILGVKNRTCLSNFCRKKDRQFDIRKKETLFMK